MTPVWPFGVRRFGTVTPPVTRAADILAAIKIAFDAAPTLDAFDPLTFGPGPPTGLTYPAARLYEQATTPSFTSANSYYEYVDLQFSLFGLDADALRVLAKAVMRVFDSRGLLLPLVDDYVMALRRTGGNLSRHDPAVVQRGGALVYQQVLTYRATIGRSL